MTRWLTTILFSLGVLHAAGISLPDGTSGACAVLCASHAPPAIEPETSCCALGDAITQPRGDDYCPMSDGPCVCGVRPVDDHLPGEPMPLPQRDRDTLQMVRAPPAPIELVEVITPQRLYAVATAETVRSGFTHNQTQAFLGVWRR
jgi:hypothetical protein